MFRSKAAENAAVNQALESMARHRFSGAVEQIDATVGKLRTARTAIQPQLVIDELLDLRNRLVKAQPKGGA